MRPVRQDAGARLVSNDFRLGFFAREIGLFVASVYLRLTRLDRSQVDIVRWLRRRARRHQTKVHTIDSRSQIAIGCQIRSGPTDIRRRRGSHLEGAWRRWACRHRTRAFVDSRRRWRNESLAEVPPSWPPHVAPGPNPVRSETGAPIQVHVYL